MNNNKIAFISCVNDDKMYDECVQYINNINVPDGYEIDIISIKEAKCITSAYNAAMNSTDAKYKVYLHQDTLIVNKDFIQDIINIFNEDNKIGMLGVVGGTNIPTNGIWWEDPEKYGQVYESHTGKMELLAFAEVKSLYEEVKAIDGLIMITQYDIPWREELFDGWHFYDTSQCVEYNLAGYKIVVPRQEKPWCLHECGIANVQNGYDKYKDIFLEEYSNKILPLVSILIPTYNQIGFLREALESAVNQTYKNIEIIIGDDSTTDEVEKFIQQYIQKYDNISYFKNESIGMDYGISNINMLLSKSNGEYVNYLYHDDIFALSKIEKMVSCFLENPNITLVTSVRQAIDENGHYINNMEAFEKLFSQTSLVSGYNMNKYIMNSLINYIGEPTTVLFKKQYINKRFGCMNNLQFECNVDVATWSELLRYGDIVYISEVLSYFRMHANQNSNKMEVYIKGVVDWYNLIQENYKNGVIHSEKEFKDIIKKWLIDFTPRLIDIINEKEVSKIYLDKLENIYHSAVKDLFDYRGLELECEICNSKVERFLPFGYKEHNTDHTVEYNIIGSDTENFSCPNCYSHDRERHIFKFFDKLDMWDKNIIDKKILHIAPERHIQEKIRQMNTEEYICGDLYPTSDTIVRVDITDIQYNDNYFDFILCNHVLEHVPNDIKAIKELYRVLKSGGYAILQTPYSQMISNSFENIEINTKELRRKYYGQSDHVRIYGQDLFEKIKLAGFKLKIVKSEELFNSEEARIYGFNNKEDLILVFKE